MKLYDYDCSQKIRSEIITKRDLGLKGQKTTTLDDGAKISSDDDHNKIFNKLNADFEIFDEENSQSDSSEGL